MDRSLEYRGDYGDVKHVAGTDVERWILTIQCTDSDRDREIEKKRIIRKKKKEKKRVIESREIASPEVRYSLYSLGGMKRQGSSRFTVRPVRSRFRGRISVARAGRYFRGLDGLKTKKELGVEPNEGQEWLKAITSRCNWLS